MQSSSRLAKRQLAAHRWNRRGPPDRYVSQYTSGVPVGRSSLVAVGWDGRDGMQPFFVWSPASPCTAFGNLAFIIKLGYCIGRALRASSPHSSADTPAGPLRAARRPSPRRAGASDLVLGVLVWLSWHVESRMSVSAPRCVHSASLFGRRGKDGRCGALVPARYKPATRQSACSPEPHAAELPVLSQ